MGAALDAGQGWGQEFSAGAALDRAIEEAVGQGRLPGAVLVVGHDGEVVYRKAYGKRALAPALGLARQAGVRIAHWALPGRRVLQLRLKPTQERAGKWRD